MNILIRPERAGDYPGIFEMYCLAFGQDTEARLVEALRRNPNVFLPRLSIVAEGDSSILGHILFTRITIENGLQKFDSLALAPMAVRTDVQQQGIGRRLIEAGLTAAEKSGHSSVIVLGHEYLYPKFGFLPAAQWNILPPFDVPGNHFMAIELRKDALKHVNGTVMYPPEFALV